MTERDKVKHTAIDILTLWKALIEEANQQEPDKLSWHRRAERQCYQDAIEAFKRNGLIKSYDVINCKVVMGSLHKDGVLYSDTPDYRYVKDVWEGK